jgi:protein SCO1/2
MNHVGKISAITMLVTGLCCSHGLLAAAADERYDPDTALDISQAAIGRQLANHSLVDTDGTSVSLHDFAGKPLVISMIFTSCHHICPTLTIHLDQAARAAREVLGEDSFEIVTLGFDAENDTPDAMAAFARAQGINTGGWHFLSATPETIAALSEETGFIFFPSPRGFDHINQLTVLDRNSIVYAQVYGVSFELPWLVEPLKDLIFNRPESVGHPWSSLVDRIRLFCTVYNPGTGRYEIDNSLFFQIAIGLMIIVSVSFYLWREFRRPRN